MQKRILLTVTGGIAAYKSCYLVRLLVRSGFEVRVLLTDAATQFIKPLTFATLSGNKVLTDMFPDPAPARPVHLETAGWGNILVIAPASADFIGKIANGLADDLAATVAMAFEGKILAAPAMNPRMWNNPAVQANVAMLRDRGIKFIGPAMGEMGGIDESPGPGRMVEPEEIVERIESLFNSGPWHGRRVIVTSGPTREPIDPIRFISNRSSGSMGDAVAIQARLRGADVILVRGKGSTAKPPSDIEIVEVETADEMLKAVQSEFKDCDLLVMAAAVADWTVENPAPSKLKKHAGPPELVFSRTEDVLSWAGAEKEHQVVVGFALETENHIEGARKKLIEKNADVIALNDPTRPDSIFGGDTTKLTILTSDGIKELPVLSKTEAAERLLDSVQSYLIDR